MSHNCSAGFWGARAQDLLNMLVANVADGDGLNMQQSTYFTLAAVQREIERATGLVHPQIRARNVPQLPIAFGDSDQALLRIVAHRFLASLGDDQLDTAFPNPHVPLVPNWISATAPPADIAALGALLGKVKNVLGS